MNDILHYTSHVAMTLGEVQLSEFRRSLVQASMSCEDRATALTLVPYNPCPFCGARGKKNDFDRVAAAKVMPSSV